MPVVDIARPRQRILQKDFKLVEFASHRWSAALQEGQTLQDALAPEFWANVSRGDGRSVLAGDIIEVRTFDHSFFAELYVRKAEVGSCLVAVMRSVDFVDRKAEAKAAQHDGLLKPKWNIATRSFDVIRASDKEVVSTGHKLKEDAQGWIEAHLSALKAA